MKNDSAAPWLRGLGVSFCATLCCSGAARADVDSVATNARFDWQAIPHRRHHANFRTPRLDDSVNTRRAERNDLRIQRDTAALARSMNNPRQYTHLMNRMSHVGIGRPGQIPAFRITDPTLIQTSIETGAKNETVNAQSPLSTDAPRRTTYLNYEGDERNLSKGFSLDLSSTDANVTVGSNLLDGQTVTINVGDNTKQVSAGSLLTPAEFAALNQKLTDGNQSLTLNNTGAATGGVLHLNLVSDDGRTIRASDLVVPESVSVVGDFARAADGIRVRNDLVNSGSIYAISSNPERRLAVIGASNITNHAGGLITTNVPDAVSGKETHNLSLALRADGNIDNSGSITSSGTLELSAKAIDNTGNAEAKLDLSINTANLTNRGLLQSRDSNIAISAPQDTHLSIDNTGGEIRAGSGDINIATTALLNPKLNTSLVGGDWHSRQLNINSADGSADANVEDVTGVVNITAGASHFHANTDDLALGEMNLSGDPTFSNSGNLILTGLGMVTNGAPLALIAGGNITAGTATTIDTSNAAGAGGTLTIVAGADFSISGNILSIVTDGLTAGGNIDLTGVTKISTTGTTNGGDVQIVALNPTFDATSGNITIPASTTITTGGGGSGSDGNVSIFSESKSSGIKIGGVDTRGGTGVGGGIQVIVRDIKLAGGVMEIDNTTGAIIFGTFFANAFPVTDASISVGDLHTSAAPITITTGNTNGNPMSFVTTGNLDTGNVGNITGSINVIGKGGVTVDGFISTQSLTVQTDGQLNFDNLTSINSLTNAAGDGGFIALLADTLTTASKELVLSAVGTAGGRGGNIEMALGLGGSKSTVSPITIGGTGSNLKLDVHGGTDGGTVFFSNLGTVTVNPGGINAAGTNGSGAKIKLSSAFESVQLNDTSFLSQADATGNNGNGGEISITASDDLIYGNSLNSPLELSADGIGTGNGGKISFGGGSTSIVPLFIGTPSKAPKTAANYITASAKSGLLGGNGGSISVRNGTSLTVDMTAIDASAQSSVGKWNGASYSLDANFFGSSNVSSLVINGSINANGVNGGNAGKVTLESNNSKTAFVINSGKTPKNGISGTISANGNLGSISVLNEHGGIKVNSQQALTAPTISLTASGDAQTTKAKITVKKAVITAGQSLSLTGYNGIGTLSVSAPTVTLNSQVGKVKVTSVPTTAVTLLDSFGGAGFTFTSGGPTTLNDIGTNKGAIKVTGGKGGLLQVAAGSNIEAKNSSVALLNLDTTSGSILIGANAKIVTSGLKAKDTIIAIGKAKKTNPFTGPNPPNMNVTQTNGTVYFGPNPSGVVATGPTAATVTATNKNVIFSNSSTNSATNKITLGSNVTVIGGQ